MKTFTIALSITGVLLLGACADVIPQQFLVAKARFEDGAGAKVKPEDGTLCIYNPNAAAPERIEGQCTVFAAEKLANDDLPKLVVLLEQAIVQADQSVLRFEYTTASGVKYVAEGEERVTFVDQYETPVACEYTGGISYGGSDEGTLCTSRTWSYFLIFRSTP